MATTYNVIHTAKEVQVSTKLTCKYGGAEEIGFKYMTRTYIVNT